MSEKSWERRAAERLRAEGFLQIEDEDDVAAVESIIRESCEAQPGPRLRELKAYLANEEAWCDEHIEDFCAQFFPAPAGGVHLQDAAMLLRMASVRFRKSGDLPFADRIVDWLKRNGLEGSIARDPEPAGGERGPECKHSPSGKHVAPRGICQYCEEEPQASAEPGTTSVTVWESADEFRAAHKEPSAPAETRGPGKLKELIKASVELAIVRHDLTDGEEDFDMYDVAADVAEAAFGNGTCAEEPIPEVKALLAAAQPSEAEAVAALRATRILRFLESNLAGNNPDDVLREPHRYGEDHVELCKLIVELRAVAAEKALAPEEGNHANGRVASVSSENRNVEKTK